MGKKNNPKAAKGAAANASLAATEGGSAPSNAGAAAFSEAKLSNGVGAVGSTASAHAQVTHVMHRTWMEAPVADDGDGAGEGKASSSSAAAADTVAEQAVLDEAASYGSTDAGFETETKEPPIPLPVPSRPDWVTDMEALKAVMDGSASDEEKTKALHDALVQRIEDGRVLDEHKTITLRRLDDSSKERERCNNERQRNLALKTKLETSCRELQTQKLSLATENQNIAEEERSRHVELKEKFEQAIKDVQEKMDAELEVRQHFLKENEDLRGKLTRFTETYEAQEQQLAEQRESREREMDVAQRRLEEHETMCAKSKVNSASLERHNEDLRKSQKILRAELQSILGKFDEFHESVTGSNQRHGECKSEIDEIQTTLNELEKDNADQRNNTQLTQLTEDQKVAQKQRDALDRLCDNLTKENKKLQEKLKGKR